MPCFTTPKQFYDTCHAHHKMGTSRRGTLSSCLRKIISRLNHFNLRLRPAGLRPSCLTFGVTSACPMFTIWWLTYLARVGLSPTGIIDLARPHTPNINPRGQLPRTIFRFHWGMELCVRFSVATSQVFGDAKMTTALLNRITHPL